MSFSPAWALSVVSELSSNTTKYRADDLGAGADNKTEVVMVFNSLGCKFEEVSLIVTNKSCLYYNKRFGAV
jgi:hypothetical protein